MLLHSFLERAVEAHSEKTVLVCGEARASYRRMKDDVDRLAHGLVARGVRRGDRVAIHLDNCYEAAVAILGTLEAGGVFMVLNHTMKLDKLAFVLNDSEARALITDRRKLTALVGLDGEAPNLAQIVALDVDDAAKEPWSVGVSGWSELLEEHAGIDGPPRVEISEDDLAALIYTSGSTGNPKGVMMAHSNMVAASTSITTYLENRPDDVVLCALPLSFDYGLYQLLMTLQFGGTLVLERSFTFPAAVLAKIPEERITGFPIVPTVLAILLQMDLTAYDLSSLRYISNTAAALPVDHIARLRELLPHVRIFSMYGLTECKRVSYLPPEELDRKPASVGKAMPNTEAWVVDDDGNPTAPGVVGELVVRGPHVMQGYWRRPEVTERMLKPGPTPGERILHTGDLFKCDEEGFLYFVGRKDDIIKSRGEKVAPREIENVLHALDGIGEAAVLGIPDSILGQAIVAFVTLREGSTLTEKDVRRHCARHMEDFMVPQYVEIMDALPRSPAGKVDKLRLEREKAKPR